MDVALSLDPKVTKKKKKKKNWQPYINNLCMCWKCHDLVVKKKKKKNGQGKPSSNTGQGSWHICIALILLSKVWIQLVSLQLLVSSRADKAL